MYGGTFDPPHKGHLHLLQSAVRQFAFDRILLVPAYIPPHKDHDPALTFDLRCAILKDWFGGISHLEISPIEQQRSGKSYTVDTVEAILTDDPGEDLYLLLGTDMFLSFETWHRFQDLLKKVYLVVGPRDQGDDLRIQAYREQLMTKCVCKGILLCDMDPVVCASSDIRAAGNGVAQRGFEHIGKELTIKRARHTLRVAEYAKRIAANNGVDPEQAYLAGLLHDCTRCYSTEWQFCYADENGILFSDEDRQTPEILHQYTGAVFAQKELGVTDPQILSAIRCHTTAKADMTPLEMVVYFADGCEPGRDYPGVDRLRTVGEKDIKQGTRLLLESSMRLLKSKNVPIHSGTKAAYESLLKELKTNGQGY